MEGMCNDTAVTTDERPLDPLLGDRESMPGVIVPDTTLALELELDADAPRRLSAAASAANVSVTRYMLQAALDKARRDES
jgi:hypothetical protein